jgi:hypothetical protein
MTTGRKERECRKAAMKEAVSGVSDSETTATGRCSASRETP